MQLKCDAVFEGGGVKGIGFAGAITALEDAGYEFENVAGTSAGAIAAALIAVGYTGKEIAEELKNVDYTKFPEKHRAQKLGAAGTLFCLTKYFGIYKSTYFLNWFQELLDKKGKHTFGDIKTGSNHPNYAFKFQAIASDITDQQMLVLPRDLAQFGIDPDDFPIAHAVQMSMSIPFFYEPYRLKDSNGKEHLIVDGGLLSNYPVWLLDTEDTLPPWPTFGLKLYSEVKEEKKRGEGIKNLVDYSKAIVSTLLDSHDNYHISRTKGDYERTILISTDIETEHGIISVQTTDFDITLEESELLFQNGCNAATKFLNNWNFGEWKYQYRL